MAIRIRTRWIDELDVMGYDAEGHSVLMSNSEYADGVKKGIAPMEAVLYALAGCTSMDVVSIMEKKRIKFTGLEVVIEAERAEEHPKVYTKVCMEYIVRGQGLDNNGVERAVQLSQEKYCPVSAMLKAAGVDVSYRITLEEE